MSPDWLTARPIAHRGLHDAKAGVIENTAGAAKAAITGGYAIECDIQLTADGEAIVFHDETLDRLTRASGAVADRRLAEIRGVRFKGCQETIPTLAEFLALIGGRVPLICEIKSHFNNDTRLANRAANIAADYAGPLAFKSFDPDVISHLRAAKTPRPLGIVAEGRYDDPYFRELSDAQKRDCAAFLHYPRTRPDFLSWHVNDLPHATPTLLREVGGLPMMAWTVRTAEQKALAREFADQVVFEGTPG